MVSLLPASIRLEGEGLCLNIKSFDVEVVYRSDKVSGTCFVVSLFHWDGLLGLRRAYLFHFILHKDF
jgi:hypothetical protein